MTRYAFTAALCLSVAACSGSSTSPSPSTTTTTAPPSAPTVTGLTVSGGPCSTNGTCTVPGTLVLTARAQLSDGTAPDVTQQADWTSSNGSVATVNGNGNVFVHNAGAADIVVTYKGRGAGVTVIVPPPWSNAGTGDNVFSMPTYVSRVTVVGDYSGFSSNFIVHVNGRGLVNELVGTGWSQTHFQGTYVTTGGTVEILFSSGVRWSFLEVRP